MAGRATGIVLGKAAFNFTDKPQFIDTRMATILRKPSVVRCSPRFIISIASPSLFERWDASPPPPFRLTRRGSPLRSSIAGWVGGEGGDANLNKRKSARFCVSNGYLSKWAMITDKSFIEVTLK
jgi:hypothetical protein